MNEHPDPGLYLIVEFEWPANVSRELGQQARALHDLAKAPTGFARWWRLLAVSAAI